MTPEFRATLSQAADLLVRLPKWAPQAGEASELFAALEQRCPAVPVELVSHHDPQTLSVDYDLFLEWPAGGILALSYTPDDGVPWSAIQAEHWAANLVVTVGGRDVTVQQALGLLPPYADGGEPPLSRRLVDAVLIRQALDEQPVTVTDEEIQDAADLFRLGNGLADAAATNEWLARRALSHEAFESLIRDKVATRRLVERVTAPDVKQYFEAHRAALASVVLTRASAAEAQPAIRLAQRARKGGDLLRAAREAALTAGGEQFTVTLRTLRCDEVEPELTGWTLGAAPGDLIGPLSLAGRHEVLQLLARKPARLDADSREAVRERLFQRWLAEQRESADIVWHWVF